MKLTSGNELVDQIGRIHFTGNVIPHTWTQWVRYTNKRGNYPDLLAIHILADIVYWYRPSEVRSEDTGHLVAWKQKFKNELLQRSPDYYSNAYGVSSKQARESIALLEKLGLIQVVRKALKTGFGVVPNVCFVAPIPNEIARITAEVNTEVLDKSLLPNSETSSAEMGNTPCPNGKQPLPNSETSSAEMGNTSIYKISLKTSSETSQESGNPPSPVPTPSPTQESFCVGGEIHLTDELDQPTIGKEERPQDLTPQPPAPPPLRMPDAPTSTNAPSDITRFEAVLANRQGDAPWLQRDDRGKLDWHPEFLEYYRRHLSASPHYAKTLCKQAELSDARLSLTNQKRSEEGREAIAIHGQRWLDAVAKEEAKRQAAQTVPFRYPEGPPLEIKKIKLQQRHRRTPAYAVS